MNGLYVSDDMQDRFEVNECRFSKYNKKLVVSLSPFIPFDVANERSAYSLLLLHSRWPSGIESEILPPDSCAVDQLKLLSSEGKLPSSLKTLIEQNMKIESTLAEQGKPNTSFEEDESIENDSDGFDGKSDSDDSNDNGPLDLNSDDDSVNDSTVEPSAFGVKDTPHFRVLNKYDYTEGQGHISRLITERKMNLSAVICFVTQTLLLWHLTRLRDIFSLTKTSIFYDLNCTESCFL